MLIFLKILVAVALALFAIIFIFKVLLKNDSSPIEESTTGTSGDESIEEQQSDFEGNVSAKKIMTNNEVYNLERLIESMPDNILICPQVSFNSFIKCDKMSLRNRFNRKSVDILCVDLDYNPVLIVEIDDDSHKSRKVRIRDLERDEIAAAAGIPTLRITDKTPTDELYILIRDYIDHAA